MPKKSKKATHGDKDEWSNDESIVYRDSSEEDTNAESSEESDADVEPDNLPPSGSRKWTGADADLHPATEHPPVKPRMTVWRDNNGKTKKSCARKMQPSIASIFSVAKKIPAPAIKEEQAESDSDIDVKFIEVHQKMIESNLVVQTPSMSSSPMEESASLPVEGHLLTEEPSEVPVPVTILEIHILTPDSDAEDNLPVHGNDDAGQEPLDEEKLKLAHGLLCSQIKKQKKHFQQKKTIQTDSKAFESVVNLEALKMYNNEYFKISLWKASVKQQLASASNLMRPALLKKLGKVSSPATTASETVAAKCCKTKYYARRLCQMAAHMQHSGTLLQTQQGKGRKHESFLTIPGVYSALEIWLRPAKMQRYVNDFLFPKLQIKGKISESTAVHWLKKLRFWLSHIMKGVYVDGHEHKDVVKVQEALITYLETQVLLTENPPDLPPGQKIYYPIFHDETCVHANDQASFVWIREDFILEKCGRLSLTPEEHAAHHSGLPKGMKQVLVEHSLFQLSLKMQCRKTQSGTTIFSQTIVLQVIKKICRTGFSSKLAGKHANFG
ncbi:hypothetical protein C8J56DRAFT_880152 [Mycena floridula]|nr:hypothetical protein C8J56DRAFT_880152 [Mycena floridula]